MSEDVYDLGVHGPWCPLCESPHRPCEDYEHYSDEQLDLIEALDHGDVRD